MPAVVVVGGKPRQDNITPRPLAKEVWSDMLPRPFIEEEWTRGPATDSPGYMTNYYSGDGHTVLMACLLNCFGGRFGSEVGLNENMNTHSSLEGSESGCQSSPNYVFKSPRKDGGRRKAETPKLRGPKGPLFQVVPSNLNPGNRLTVSGGRVNFDPQKSCFRPPPF